MMNTKKKVAAFQISVNSLCTCDTTSHVSHNITLVSTDDICIILPEQSFEGRSFTWREFHVVVFSLESTICNSFTYCTKLCLQTK